jgi:hypothetical protein
MPAFSDDVYTRNQCKAQKESDCDKNSPAVWGIYWTATFEQANVDCAKNERHKTGYGECVGNVVDKAEDDQINYWHCERD